VSPSLIELAYFTQRLEGTKALFIATLAELGERLPSERESVLRLARATAAMILSGQLGTQEGARSIARLSRLTVDSVLALHPFVYVTAWP
jgi:hypothetical protein